MRHARCVYCGPPRKTPTTMKHITLLVPEEGIASCLVGIQDVFRKANEYLRDTRGHVRPYFDLAAVGLTGREVQVGNLRFACRHTLADMPRTDLILVPSIEGDLPRLLEKYAGMVAMLRARYADGRTEIATTCSGAFFLAATGLVDGREVATHWAVAPVLEALFPRVRPAAGLITDADRLYTCGGATAYLNLVLYLIEKYADREVANWLARMFLIDRDRDTQRHFVLFQPQKQHADRPILEAQQYIEAHYDDPPTVAALAARVGLSRRHFIRRFKQATYNTPLQYIQRVRIEAAKKALEATSDTVQEIMYRVGYNDVKAFRALFRRETGLTPLHYRRKYRARLRPAA